MIDNLFNTPTDEVNRLITELSETREALRDVSSRLNRIETRLKRAFPHAFANRPAKERSENPRKEIGVPTLTSETAQKLYEEIIEQARKSGVEDVRDRLSALSLPDLSFLRHELGASLGKRKPSAKTLIEIILGRVRESVMLSRHTDRQQLVEQSAMPKNPSKEGEGQ